MTKYCSWPFITTFIKDDGDVCFPCGFCSKGHPIVIGNILKKNLDEIWNGDIAKKVRKSIIDGTFVYCDKEKCHRLEPETIFNAQDFNPEAPPPQFISLSTDSTCNLRCGSCRTRNHKMINVAQLQATKLYSVISPFLKEAKSLALLGTGEIFASESTLKWLSTIDRNMYPKLKIWITTNAQLLADKWYHIKNIETMIEFMFISIDAATKSTYENLRRGGIWERLLKSIDYILTLREKLNYKIRISFLVQKDNFKEMTDFIKLAESWKVDEVLFQRITNFGHLTTLENLDVADPNHPSYSNFKSIRDNVLAMKTNLKITWDKTLL